MENSKFLGVDLSEHNLNIDFTKLKNNGIDFVILRAGYGKVITQKDKLFEDYYNKAKQAGLKVGCYWYSYAETQQELLIECQVFLELIKGKQFEYPVFLDIEEQKTFLIQNLEETVINGLSMMENTGYFVGVYCSQYYLDKYFNNVKNRFVTWVANWNGDPLSVLNRNGIHQYVVEKNVLFHDKDLDYNMSNYDYSKPIIDLGLNGYPKKQENIVNEINDCYVKYEQLQDGVKSIQNKLKNVMDEIDKLINC
mgnify:CR=1 FL=1